MAERQVKTKERAADHGEAFTMRQWLRITAIL